MLEASVNGRFYLTSLYRPTSGQKPRWKSEKTQRQSMVLGNEFRKDMFSTSSKPQQRLYRANNIQGRLVSLRPAIEKVR